MSRNQSAVAVFTLMLFIALPGVAQAPPSADAFVTDTQPAANFGSRPFLPVQAGTISYVRFNLGALPANASIAKATLRLYVNAVAAPGSFDIYEVNSGWNEQGIRFNNAPTLGSSATGGHQVQITTASVNQFILIDITPLAQSWINGSTANNGVGLALSSVKGSFSFDSKESTGTGHQPELEVVFDSVTTTPGTDVASSKLAAGGSAGILQGPGPDPYVDNGTALQTGANFNIDGNGSAASFNAASQYLLGGTPVLGSNGTSSLFVGPGAGQSNTGAQNTFLGVSAGQANTTGNYNTFAGTLAGLNNASGSYLTFLGMRSGTNNTSGIYNSFVGTNSGYSNTTGSYNSFMGTLSGEYNSTGTYLTFLGTASGFSNTTGTYNSFLGAYSGWSNTTGSFLTFLGMQSGVFNTTGNNNSFVGTNSGYSNTTGSFNSFMGSYSGFNNTTGSNNTFVGSKSGLNADPAAHNNVYISSAGASGENGTIRFGDPTTQSAAFIAGISGASTNSGVPVFIDSTGKLGTGGGNVSFTQVTGTLTSSQLTGTYSNQVSLSNTTNVVDGTFVGNGAGLTGVASGLTWPVVQQTADYAVQLSDFSTPTTHGNFLVLKSTVSHTFTLPNPPPPTNGSCVAIGNAADAGINSGTNVFLTVNPNGVNMDTFRSTNSVTPTMPRHTAYLYCTDGANYFRLGYAQNGVSEIGPGIKTVDTGTVNVMQSTFRNGMDFGLADGSMIFIQPKFANTSGIVTLNLNGLSPTNPPKVLKYGLQVLAPGDLQPNTFALLIYNLNGTYWELVNPQTSQVLGATTPSLGGSLISAGSCTSGTVTVNGATVGHPVSVSASDGSLPDASIILSASVTASNTVTVQLCAVANVTLATKTYNVVTQ